MACVPAKGKKNISLDAALADQLPRLTEVRDRGLAQRLAYTSIRWLGATEFFTQKLLKKPLKSKDRDIHLLIQLGLVQLWREEIPAHAAVHETAAVARGLGKPWAVSLINGVLRNFQRQRAELESALEDSPARWSAPAWLRKRLAQDWPQHWQAIITANTQQAPMWLRVNLNKHSRDDYLKLLDKHDMPATAGSWSNAAICLDKACPVEQLPEFNQGAVSVQDAAAQLAAEILNPQPGDRVLDACAAPGSKTCHMLEFESEISELIALDNNPGRLRRLTENLQRLELKCKLVSGDAGDSSAWFDGQLFDRILLDAPCSSLGVIRRHPDIQWRRQPEDINTVTAIQRRLLEHCWTLLKPGGHLLYASCSILPIENQNLIKGWLSTVSDATPIPIDTNWGLVAGYGRQLLPGQSDGGDDSDGFFYCLLEKASI